jgi:hypothetical protein
MPEIKLVASKVLPAECWQQAVQGTDKWSSPDKEYEVS